MVVEAVRQYTVENLTDNGKILEKREFGKPVWCVINTVNQIY